MKQSILNGNCLPFCVMHGNSGVFLILSSINVSSGSRELLDEGGNQSLSDSDSPVPTCMPFSWFGESHKESASSGSLNFPHSGSELSADQERSRNKVNIEILYVIFPIGLLSALYCSEEVLMILCIVTIAAVNIMQVDSAHMDRTLQGVKIAVCIYLCLCLLL